MDRHQPTRFFPVIYFVIGLLLFDLGGNGGVHADEARYLYDQLGRLQAVIDADGNAAIYHYDAVGNLLSITRTDTAPTGVSITFFSPDKGLVGTEVTLFGSGFSPMPADNEVQFNGVTTEVLSSTFNQLVARVPDGASTGPISLTNPNGSATTTQDFTLTLPLSVEISPTTAVVVAGTARQFTATGEGTTNDNVVWSFEGVGTNVGTISDTGLYSVPSDFADTALILIKATSLVDPTKSATATVSVLPSTPLGPVTAPQVSVEIQQAPVSTGPFVAPQVSVEIEEAATSSGPLVAPQVSVAIEQAPTPSGPFVAPQVSVEIEQALVPSGPSVAPQVSVEVEQAPTSSGPLVAPQVSVALTPLISAIDPNSGVQGSTNLPITITGTGLIGATSLSFLVNGAPDTSITANNVTANAEGTQATAELTIDSAAPTGLRVVRIITPNGSSPAAAMEGNIFVVTAP